MTFVEDTQVQLTQVLAGANYATTAAVNNICLLSFQLFEVDVVTGLMSLNTKTWFSINAVTGDLSLKKYEVNTGTYAVKWTQNGRVTTLNNF